MKIGIDVDGVILDFERELRTRAELYDLLELHGNGVKDNSKFNIEERYGWNKEDGENFIKKYFLEVSRYANIIPGAKEVINLLRKNKHQLIIISSRGYDDIKMQTIAENILYKENLIFDKYYWRTLNKLKICMKEEIDLMIDDNYMICKDLSEHGINTLYLRDVNKKILQENIYLKEVNSWGEIYRYIYNKTEQ